MVASPFRDHAAGASKSAPEMPHSKIEVRGLDVEIPSLILECFDYILQHGLVEGIFRVSGSAKRMRESTSNYTTCHKWLVESSPSPHDVAGVAKKLTREYIQSIGGLFRPSVLASLRGIVQSQCEKQSIVSSNSYQSADTSFESSTDQTPGNNNASYTSSSMVNAISAILVSRNSARKNAIFIYYIDVLSQICRHTEETKMPTLNIAIVFQQYLFETGNVAELQSYQNLLVFFLENAEEFMAKYKSDLDLLGGVEDGDYDNDGLSIIGADSPPQSPNPAFSVSQSSPSKSYLSSSINVRRRSSLSQKLNSFWDSYSSPANKSKRFSFMSRNSARSSELLETPSESSCEHTNPYDNIMKSLSSHEDITEGIMNNCNDSYFDSETRETSRHSSVTDTQPTPIALSRNASKRKSFLSFLRPNVSTSAVAEFKPDAGSSPVEISSPITPPAIEMPFSANASAEELGGKDKGGSFPVQTFNRRFSLRFRKR